jgi:hypothetical protein
LKKKGVRGILKEAIMEKKIDIAGAGLAEMLVSKNLMTKD